MGFTFYQDSRCKHIICLEVFPGGLISERCAEMTYRLCLSPLEDDLLSVDCKSSPLKKYTLSAHKSSRKGTALNEISTWEHMKCNKPGLLVHVENVFLVCSVQIKHPVF